jgi:hypothetical protein
MAMSTTTGNSHAAAAQRGPPGPSQYAAMVANTTLAASQASHRNQTLRGRLDDTGGPYGYFALLVIMALLYATRYGFDAIARRYKDAASSQPIRGMAVEYITASGRSALITNQL